jgi:hypothetical protein
MARQQTKKLAAVTTGLAEQPSLRNDVRAYTCSPRRPGFFATVIPRLVTARLDTSVGCQNHTISPSASAPFVRATKSRASLSQPSHPRLTFRDDSAYAPSRPRRDAHIKLLIWGRGQAILRKSEYAFLRQTGTTGSFAHGAYAGIARRARSVGGRAICPPSFARHDGRRETHLETQRLRSDGRHGAYGSSHPTNRI